MTHKISLLAALVLALLANEAAFAQGHLSGAGHSASRNSYDSSTDFQRQQ